MYKTTGILAVASVALFGAPRTIEAPPSLLKEESMTLEYTVTHNEVAVRLHAESEVGLEGVEVLNPNGQPVLRMRAWGGRSLPLSGFKIESLEFPLHEFRRSFVGGRYDIRARTSAGGMATGEAILDFELPAIPVVLYPQEGAVNVPTNLTVAWINDPAAVQYHVVLEQNENDGLEVDLPAGTSQFSVPDGVLAPGTETQVEVGSIGPNGNITVVENIFWTW